MPAIRRPAWILVSPNLRELSQATAVRRHRENLRDAGDPTMERDPIAGRRPVGPRVVYAAVVNVRRDQLGSWPSRSELNAKRLPSGANEGDSEFANRANVARSAQHSCTRS